MAVISREELAALAAALAHGHAIGWVLGWVEENKHPYFFVINLESPNPTADLPAAGLAIARGILTQMGFFQGKK